MDKAKDNVAILQTTALTACGCPVILSISIDLEPKAYSNYTWDTQLVKLSRIFHRCFSN